MQTGMPNLLQASFTSALEMYELSRDRSRSRMTSPGIGFFDKNFMIHSKRRGPSPSVSGLVAPTFPFDVLRNAKLSASKRSSRSSKTRIFLDEPATAVCLGLILLPPNAYLETS